MSFYNSNILRKFKRKANTLINQQISVDYKSLGKTSFLKTEVD